MIATLNPANTPAPPPPPLPAESPSAPKKRKKKTPIKLGSFFKKDRDRETSKKQQAQQQAQQEEEVHANSNTPTSSGSSVAGSISSRMSQMSMSITSSSRRGSTKKRISQFVREDSKSQTKHLWGDHGDTTSEESYSSINNNNPAASAGSGSPPAIHTKQLGLGPEGSASPTGPGTKKRVRFSSPIVAMCVEVESSWMIWGYGRTDLNAPNNISTLQQLKLAKQAKQQSKKEAQKKAQRDKGKAKATLLDGSHLFISKEDMAGYDPKELMAAQPAQPKFLGPNELKALRHQKERLNKYRRKLKQKLRRVRKARCDKLKQLAEECVLESQNRQGRIIARYKMAAPNAVEHRRRRTIKFAMARAARTIFLVQQRQRHLQAIRLASQERKDRIKAQQSHINVGLPHYHIRHQMKRIMVHQASMKALIRLQQMDVRMPEATWPAIVFDIPNEVPKRNIRWNFQKNLPDLTDEPEEDKDEGDTEYEDDDLDTQELNFRRLEWAQVSFHAAVRSKEFLRRIRGTDAASVAMETTSTTNTAIEI